MREIRLEAPAPGDRLGKLDDGRSKIDGTPNDDTTGGAGDAVPTGEATTVANNFPANSFQKWSRKFFIALLMLP